MKQDNGHNIAESKADFIGYEILYIEYWKEGVKRVWMKKDNSMYIVFSKEEYTQNLVVTGD